MIEQESAQSSGDTWPEFPFAEWGDTLATFHLWTQIVGKVVKAASATKPHGRAAMNLSTRVFTTHGLGVKLTMSIHIG